ncbi:MAG TPA: hypothetical protein VF305_02480 [Smithellaceae bacterium]
MKKQLFNVMYLISPAIFVFLCACQTTSSNLSSDPNNYNVNLHLIDYFPKLDAAKYQQFKGKKICMSNIRNNAGNTTNFSYYSKDLKVQYQLSHASNTPIQFIPSYFWYAYQKAFQYAGIEASADCSSANLPELWIIFQSFNDEELQLKITVLKNRETLYEKDLIITMAASSSRNSILLKIRAYEMIDLTITTILDDPGLQAILLQ